MALSAFASYTTTVRNLDMDKNFILTNVLLSGAKLSLLTTLD